VVAPEGTVAVKGLRVSGADTLRKALAAGLEAAST